VCITAITTLGSNANNTFSYVGTRVGATGSWSPTGCASRPMRTSTTAWLFRLQETPMTLLFRSSPPNSPAGTGTWPRGPKHTVRKGAQVVEFALLLPFLAFMFVIAVDWARVFYYSIAVTNCARNGALYLSQQQSAKTTTSPYTDSGYVNMYVNSANPLTAAALADASDLTPTPTVTSTSGTDSSGPYVEVTVSYLFQTVTNFSVGVFGVPASTNVTRTVRMYVPPESPN
jgi:Flp pilus assembly protein TadG